MRYVEDIISDIAVEYTCHIVYNDKDSLNDFKILNLQELKVILLNLANKGHKKLMYYVVKL